MIQKNFLSNNLKSALFLLLLVLGLGVFMLAVAPVAANDPAPDQGTVRFEVRFMTGMIDHHTMAIMMAELCLEKAVHEELQAMCEDILATQSQEIELMQSWLTDWYDISYEPQLKPGDQKMHERLAQLTGAEFEIEFMQTMIKHHRQAIREAESCVKRAYHDELRNLCQSLITQQSAEIEQMQTWLCEWYEICKEK